MKAMLVLISGLIFSFAAMAVSPTTTTTVKSIGQKTGEAIDGAVSSVKRKKDETTAGLQKSYDDVSKKISELKTQAAATSGQAQKDMQAEIKSLEKDQQKVAAKIEKMKTATGSAWEELKQGATKALDSMKKAVDKAEDKLK
jgi:DNA anti-recombination protein RmuC